MASSLAQVGQLQPIVARLPGPPYEIVVGHCRSLAAQRLGWVSLSARLVEATDDEVFWMRAHENGKRIGLSPAERVKEAVEAVGACDGDVDAAAYRLGYTRGTVDGWLEVAGWPDDVRVAVYDQSLSRAAASWLARVTADDDRVYMLRQAIELGYGERVTRHWYQDWHVSGVVRDQGRNPPGPGRVAAPIPDPVMPCYFCGQSFSFASLQYLWVCRRCAEEIAAHRPEPEGVSGVPVATER